jgi:hypothetical protein
VLKPRRRRKTESGVPAQSAASKLRHDLRNKFSSILNAVTYIERSLEKMQLLDRDPRIARFVTLVGEELEAADRLLDTRDRHTKRRGTGKPRIRD